MPTVLSADELTEALGELPEWSGDVKGIERAVKARSFLAGIRLVDAVAELAEAADHHPDIDIRWRTLTFACVTHSAGGVTDRDLTLAARIDEIVRSARRG